jgi:predicted nucleotidyltransferase
LEEHHERAIERLRREFAEDPRFPAMLVGGSIVKGLERPDSDVDILLVATDEEFKSRRRIRDTVFLSGDFTDYEGGYIDGKVVDLDFLRDVAERGSEPARWAFVGAHLVYSRLPEVGELLERIVGYRHDEAKAKIEAFFVQVRVQRWFVAEAEKRGDRYLLHRSAADMVLFAGRILLAQNAILFPSHKWFMHTVRNAPNQPKGFCELLDAVLENPCEEGASRLEECVVQHYEQGLSWTQTLTRYIEDREWNWRDGKVPIEDS